MSTFVIVLALLSNLVFGFLDLSQIPNVPIYGFSAADASALSVGLQTFTDSQTFTVDNRNFSQAIGSSQFAVADPSAIAGGALSQGAVLRAANGTATAGGSGFANSLLLGYNPSGNGVIGQGASSINIAATPDAAGLNATAATLAAVNGVGTLLWQNQAGGSIFSPNGPASYNFTTRYNATGENATIAELVNVRLVSNENETGSALTICVGDGSNCGTVVNP
eukprot:TRINITY_DN6482_c0_g1_i1.p3 TRINITY_DN6482_c0_g1~~TRINITY_DN6482_c0_g1_i1.p3  ORF type:complete len:222 (-),score=41.29 TRINITY_DN6482_c0_g1_i1:342-1007(-)